MRKFERFLVSVLWLSAMAILALWFFNMRFGFNILAHAHWEYLEELQLADQVAKDFYIAIAATGAIAIIGLYILIVPWHRRIKMQRAAAVADVFNASEQAEAAAKMPDMSRPPRLNMNNMFIPTAREAIEIPKAAPMQMQAPAQAQPQFQSSEIEDIIVNAGFQLKKPFRAAGVRIDFVGIGADEKMIIGTNDARADLSRAVEKIKGLFDEVLDDDLKINLVAFSTRDFADLGAAAAFVNANRARPQTDDDAEDFAAFSNFTDTVAGYFGNV
ncbi:MAG: hypothetical protein LBL46_04395 [Rickettsiales bacterium]|jgi:hypothetical protein|nr:hypothetical protein [Rickettsiales bacterium]